VFLSIDIFSTYLREILNEEIKKGNRMCSFSHLIKQEKEMNNKWHFKIEMTFFSLRLMDEGKIEMNDFIVTSDPFNLILAI